MLLENLGEDVPLSAADVEQVREPTERKPGRDFGALGTVDAAHELAHVLAACLIGSEPLEERCAVDFLKCRLTRLHYGTEIAPSVEHRIVIEHENHLAERRRDVLAHVAGDIGV